AAGVAHFHVAAQKGDATAQVALSGMHERGDNGFDKSWPKAYAWARLAERQTFSNGALLAVQNALNGLRGRMTDEDMARSEAYSWAIAGKIPKFDYSSCGQFNIDASRDPSIASYYQF